MTAVVLLASAAGGGEVAIPWWALLPFALLLLLIAVMPLTPHRIKHAWEHGYPWVAGGLGLFVAVGYLLALPDGAHVVVETLHEYASFIVLLAALFVAAGGILIRIRGEAKPSFNVVYLFGGACLANLIGTTGASMVLIRPFLRINKYRVTGFHVVFFIFIVSNVGGALTPIGDPPLFLGFLHGVPFFWLVGQAILPWAFTVGLLLAVFYIIDLRNFRRAPAPVREKETGREPAVTVRGAHNVLFLALVVVAVFLPAQWFIRELTMLGAAAFAYRSTDPSIRQANEFTFGPIREVAFLFFGIFLTMMPALGYLGQHGSEFGLTSPQQYYLASGSLSSVLDNAPTYLNFLKLEETVLPPADVQARAAAAAPADREQVLVDWLLGGAAPYVVAISLGSVFFGAMTYIGNGPNFMVKSIAESSGVRVPSFFGYLLQFSLPVLFPVLLLVGWIFL